MTPLPATGHRSLFQRIANSLPGLFLLAAAVELTLGLVIPVITVRSAIDLKIATMNLALFEDRQSFTILAGIESLFRSQELFLGWLVIAFSVVLPAIKIITATVLATSIPTATGRPERLLNVLTYLGRWSFADVVCVAVIVAVTKLKLAQAMSEPGIYHFSASAALAMAGTTLLRFRGLNNHP